MVVVVAFLGVLVGISSLAGIVCSGCMLLDGGDGIVVERCGLWPSLAALGDPFVPFLCPSFLLRPCMCDILWLNDQYFH